MDQERYLITLGSWGLASIVPGEHVPLPRLDGGRESYVAIRDGSVVGIGVSLDAPAAGSPLVVDVTKNGEPVTGCAIVIEPGSSVHHQVKFSDELHGFAAGDLLGVNITTYDGWATLNAGIGVDIEVLERGED